MVETNMNTKYQEILNKYSVTDEPTSQEKVDEIFDQQSIQRMQENNKKQVRISNISNVEQNKVDGVTAIANVQHNMAEMALEHGKLDGDMRDLIRSFSSEDKLFTKGELFRIKLYDLIGRHNKANAMKRNIATRTYKTINILADKVSEIAVETFETSKDAKNKIESLLNMNVAERKRLNYKFVEFLRGGTYSTSDLTIAEKEANKIQAELDEMEKVISGYEKQIKVARANEDTTKVEELANQMDNLMTIQQKIMDGQLASDGIVSKIRRELLGSASGVQTARDAIASAKVNYQALTLLVDIASETETKYKHSVDMILNQYKEQAQIAYLSFQQGDMKNVLANISQQSQDMMEALPTLLSNLARESYEFFTAPFYDSARAKSLEETIRVTKNTYNKMKVDWAAGEMTIKKEDVSEGPHYSVNE